MVGPDNLSKGLFTSPSARLRYGPTAASPTWPGLPTNIDFNVNVIGRVIVVVYFIVMVIVIFICQLYLLLALGLAMEPATWTGTFTGLELTCEYLCVCC